MRPLCAALWTALIFPSVAQADQRSEDEAAELAMAYGGQPVISIATGAGLPLRRAPAVASVITAEDIAAMGAVDLDEVMESLPGVHVARSTQASTPMYVIRGFNVGFNPQVLLLINGIPVTTAYTGNRGNVWGGLPLENVARVEVIRGPGSALYGAEAFAGVINVITKSASEIDGTEVGLRAGSFKSRDGWILHGGQWGAVQVAGYLRVGSTDGHRRIVEADAQTGWDQRLGSHVSLAPGPIDNQRQFLDGQLDLSLDAWRLRLGYRERDRVGAGTGVASALDPTGQSYSQAVDAALSYEQTNLVPDLGVKLEASVMHHKEFSDLTLFPPGFPGFDGRPFVDGMIGNPYKWERHARLAGTFTYTGLDNHRLVLGLGAERDALYKATESKNFNPNFTSIGQGSVADVVDVTNTVPFIRPHGRTKHHVFVQDEWQIVKDWTLTAGIRHDKDTDYGTTTNPRLALVWDTTYNVTTKLLYGTAFRAPSLVELYAINNPVVTGNPDLKPEKIRTIEGAVSWQPDSQWQVSGNVYHYMASDIIRLVNLVYQNTGQIKGTGLEFEASWQPNSTWRATGNYSLQRTIDQASGQDAGLAPKHQVYLRADWRFRTGWSAHAQVNWISQQIRSPGDTRDALKGRETVDLTVRQDNDSSKGWAVAMSVRNLFDADVREPSPFDQSPGQPFISVPNDFPGAGRSVMVQASYRF